MAQHELTFELGVSGTNLMVHYHQDGRPLRNMAGNQLPPVIAQVPAGLSAARDAFARGDWHQLQAQFGPAGQVPFGHALFEMLFPNAARVSDTLKAASKHDSYSTLQADARSIRARIVTNDPTLAALPWRLTRSGHTTLATSLAKWTFEVADAVTAQQDVAFPAPARVLVIAPESGEPALPTNQHVDALHARLLKHSEQYTQSPYWVVARTLAEIRHGAKFHPDLIYYFGHGRSQGGRMCAVLDDCSYPFDALLTLLPKPPRALYLNGCHSGGAGWWGVGPALSGKIPLVLSHPTVAWSARAGAQALDWIDAVIGQGACPVQALHQTALGAKSLVFEASMVAAHTHFGRWTPGKRLSPQLTPVHHRLDRYPQRRPTVEEFERLLETNRRVCTLVGHGSLDNQPGDLQSLLEGHTTKKIGRRAQIIWKPVPLPIDRPLSHDRLDAALRTALGLQRGPSLGECCRHATTPLPPNKTTVLALKWGMTSLGNGDGALSSEDLDAWLLFQKHLSTEPNIPASLRVMNLVTFSTQGQQGDGLMRMVQDYDAKYGASRAVRFVALPPLGIVPRHELIDHLRDETRCPSEDAPAIADLLLKASKIGQYNLLVPLIEAGENANWASLIRQAASARTKAYF